MKTPARLLVLAAAFVTTFVAGASTALADAPAGPDWPDPAPISKLDVLLLFGGGTLGLFVLVSLFGLLTARNNYVPPPPSQDLATTSDDLAHH